MPKMRTINDAYKEIIKSDPETAITVSGIRRLVKEQKIPSVRVGRRIIIDVDNMLQYFSTSKRSSKYDKTLDYGTIRQIT